MKSKKNHKPKIKKTYNIVDYRNSFKCVRLNKFKIEVYNGSVNEIKIENRIVLEKYPKERVSNLELFITIIKVIEVLFCVISILVELKVIHA